MTDAAFSKSEMMIVAAARELAGQHVCFVGVGLPNIAVNLAKRTVDAGPRARLRGRRLRGPAGPAAAVASATRRSSPARPRVVSMYELFSFYLQGGLIDVGFLGAAQIDRFGNINTTVIGDYDAPIDAPARQRRGMRDRDQCPRGVRDHAPVEALVRRDRSTSGRPPATSAARRASERIRREQGWLGRGPSVVVTDLGIWHFDDDGEMRLDSLHPGATLDDVRAATGWEPSVAPSLAETPAPTADELRLIREELDPGGAYTK